MLLMLRKHEKAMLYNTNVTCDNMISLLTVYQFQFQVYFIFVTLMGKCYAL